MDLDGVQDILLATYNGEVMVFKDTVRLCIHSCSPNLLGYQYSYRACRKVLMLCAVQGYTGSCSSEAWYTGACVCVCVCVSPQGEQLPMGLTVPRLKVKRQWFKGLNPDPNIRDPSAMGGDSEDGEKKTPFGTLKGTGSTQRSGTQGSKRSPLPAGAPRPITEQVAKQLREYRQKMIEYRDKYSDVALRQLLRETHMVNPTFYSLLMKQLSEEGLVDAVRG